MEYNPLTPEMAENPFPTFRWLRDNAPAYYNPEQCAGLPQPGDHAAHPSRDRVNPFLFAAISYASTKE